jgi:GNAT superfamily N-acetyltransferase
MIDDWFETVELAIPFDRFLALPRNPAYKYEYYDGRAVLSPRPKSYHAALDLQPRRDTDPIDVWHKPVVIRPLQDDDWDTLPSLFSAAFWSVLPFSTLDEPKRLDAALRCLEKTRDGRDGALIPTACFIAVDSETDHCIGASLVTALAKTRDEELDRLAVNGVLPHLTWIFVAPMLTRHGVGSALLDSTVNELIKLGHRTLASTFLLGNESSVLWHWSNGFRLLSYLASPRRYLRPRRSARLESQPDADGPVAE